MRTMYTYVFLWIARKVPFNVKDEKEKQKKKVVATHDNFGTWTAVLEPDKTP